MDWHSQNEIRETTFNADHALSTFKACEHFLLCIRDQPSYKYDKLLTSREQQMKEPDVHWNRIFNPMPRWDKCVNVPDDRIKNIDTLFK